MQRGVHETTGVRANFWAFEHADVHLSLKPAPSLDSRC